MNTIKTIKFKAPLFRANKNIFKKLPNGTERKIYNSSSAKKNTLASNNYKNAPVKYFTLNRKNVEAYTKEGTTHIKNWNVTNELNLVDILDLDTRKALENKFKNDIVFVKAINEAFPIIDNKVHRISSSSEEDNNVLNKICELEYDGYYMNVEGKNIGFHSEVGLCKKAFGKLKLNKNSQIKIAPQKTRKRTRAEYEAQISPNRVKPLSPNRLKPVSPFKGSLFGLLGNNENVKNMPNLPVQSRKLIESNNNGNVNFVERARKRMRFTQKNKN